MDLEPPATGKYPFLGLSAAAIAGILAADFHPQPFATSCIATGSFLLVWCAFRRTVSTLFLVAACFFLLHGLQYDRNPARLLAAELGEGELTITGSGMVDSVPVLTTSSNGRVRSSFQLRAAELILEDTTGITNLSLLVNWPGSDLKIGDYVQFEGNLKNVPPPRNPGEFDYAAWLARQQIHSQVTIPYARNAHVTQRGSPWNLRRLAHESNLKLAAILTKDLEDSPIEAGVISAIMLGTRDDTPDATVELFLRTGTLHLFSVSGLHVTMLAGIALFAFTMLRIPRRTALLLTIPTVFVYALITGWNAASVRAAIMTSAFAVATLLDRPSLSINTLAVSCFLLLISNTNQLFSTGFQLSYLVVGSIILLSGPITRWLQQFARPDPFIPRKLLTPMQKSRWHFAHGLGGKVGLTLAAWIGSLPLTAAYFHLLSPVALLANFFIIPLAFGIVVLGVWCLVSSLASGWLVVCFNNASWLAVKLLLLILGLLAAIPAGSLFVGPHWWQRPSQQKVTFLDLGSGGAAVIETSGSCWLVDCGSEADYRRVVRRYLQKQGINHVNGLILTHGDGGHIGGVGQFQIDFPEAGIFFPEAGAGALVFRRLLAGTTGNALATGASFPLDAQTRIDVLWPPAKVDGGRADDHCLVLRLKMHTRTFLLTSDMGLTAEMNLLKVDPAALQSDWLVMGRHRGDPAGSKTFLKAVNAKNLLQTVASFPGSEKMPPALVATADQLGIRLARFDQTGAVQIQFENSEVEMIPFLNGH